MVVKSRGRLKMEEIALREKINRYIMAYPWYFGLTADLLFYIAIDSLFLTVVKNFSAAQIVSLVSFSQFACIALQFPVLFIIKKIGNTTSVRTGAFFMLLSAICITFGAQYYLVLIGRIFHDISVLFRSASVVALENNLELLNRRRDFVRIRTSANTVYSVITMLISFVASFMFNQNHYLPMLGCITTCAIGFIISLMMKDYSEYNKVSSKTQGGKKVKIQWSKFIILAIVGYGIFYTVINGGQSEGKLFIQEHLFLDFNVEETALIIGAIICASRIIRVFSNIVFAKLYEKYKGKMGIALPALLAAAIGCILFGAYIPHVLVKISVMAVGYVIILFARDPFNLCMQDVLFENTPREQHQTLLAMLELGVKLARAGTSLGFSALLVHYPMALVVSILFAISVLEIIVSVKLYKAVLAGKNQLQPEAACAR